MDDDFDLDGLSVVDARQYVAEFISAYRQTLNQLSDAERDLEAWKKRAGLALDQGDKVLAQDAIIRAEETVAKVAKLKQEASSLDFKVLELKRRLKELEQKPQMSVNAEALLEQMESIVGTDHETDHALADAEAEAALEALKRKMESEQES